MRASQLLTGAAVFDGNTLHHNLAVMTDDAWRFVGLCRCDQVPADMPRQPLDGGILSPGFVDLQVNGGGGVLFNEAPNADTLHTISETHARLGTHGILPTLISDTPQKRDAAIDAVKTALADNNRTIMGIHLEGPHIATNRRGIHDQGAIRPMEKDDLRAIVRATEYLPNVLLTLAPESVRIGQVEALTQAGVIVSIGHSDCDYDTAMRYFDAGAVCLTHLFNAMSPLHHRAPGLVGAFLHHPQVKASLIADGIHVHPAAVHIARSLRSDALFLVSDSTSICGTDATSFSWKGVCISRQNGTLTAPDGTLAGADLDMKTAVRNMVRIMNTPITDALMMATRNPASVLKSPLNQGTLTENSAQPIIHLPSDFF